MKCPASDDWNLLAAGALGRERAASMLTHARACRACGTAYDAARRGHVELMRMYEALACDHDELREQLMAVLPSDPPARGGAGRLPNARRRLGDLLMTLNTRTTRRTAAVFATAACLVIAVVVFLSGGEKSAFARAIEHLKQAETIACDVTWTINFEMRPAAGARSTGEPLSKEQAAYSTSTARHEKLFMSAEDGVRRDIYEDGEVVSTTYKPADGPALLLDRKNRTYERLLTDTEEIPEEYREAAAHYPAPEVSFAALPDDPDRLLHALRNLTADADRELGPQVIEGRDVVGYEIAGEKVGFGPPWTDESRENRAELWVDSETGLPVRLVFHYAKEVAATQAIPREMSYVLTVVYDAFEWEPALAPDWFAAVIPEGYAPHESTAPQPMVAPDEAALLAALRQFSELAGRYPTSLNVSDVSYEVAVLAGTARAKQLVAKRAGRKEPPSPDLKPLSGLTYFALLEMQGRKPEYFGAEVEPGRADRVLMRWTLESGEVRVIYGDLKTETRSPASP